MEHDCSGKTSPLFLTATLPSMTHRSPLPVLEALEGTLATRIDCHLAFLFALRNYLAYISHLLLHILSDSDIITSVLLRATEWQCLPVTHQEPRNRTM